MIDLTVLDALERPHLSGHRCPDERGVLGWFNPQAGARERCPVLVAAASLRAQVTGLLADLQAERQRPHEAAHQLPAVVAVAEGMTGLVMADLAAEDREGWQQTARYAIEALAAWLDPAAAEVVQ